MSDPVRLSKRMAELGLSSRREADDWISRGWVRVDGAVVDVLGTKVDPTQQISIERAAKDQQAAKFTVVLNKPVGYVSGQAENGYRLAASLVTMQNRWTRDRAVLPRRMPSRLVPAGRLDIESVGLLILTEDGRVARQLIGAESNIEKEYLVRVRRSESFGDGQLALLRHGLELDGVALRRAEVSWQNEDQLRFVLCEGRKRQIRRMCHAVGLEVLALKRVRIGRVMLGDLPAGQWRLLRVDESF